MYFICGSLSIWTVPGLDILAHISFLFSRKFSRVKDAPHSRFRCGNPNQCLSNVLKMLILALPQIYTPVFHLWKNYQFAQCLGWRFPPISTFFSLVSSRAFRDAPHSRFRCRDLNQCLPNHLKMLLLALRHINTRVFHWWKSIDLDNA